LKNGEFTGKHAGSVSHERDGTICHCDETSDNS
jgi:hypothetical protein